MENQNSVAKLLRIIGIVVMIGGVLFALMVDTSTPEGGLHWGRTLTVLFSSFVSGMLFIGFSEVIALLQKIHLQLQQGGSKASATPVNEREVEQPQEQTEWQPSPQDLEDIRALYHGRKITKIEASPYQDYCAVQLEGEADIEVVELGGFKPKKVSAAAKPDLVDRIRKWFNNLHSS
ncbi:hypothetical protein [Mesobacillus subterraneus]|uniref:Uncharacterized protein n=1 Tax=Mesobacillus subterraneus TaxID=285983 RepID=A0A427TX45_9BACI|nr:hypothetical protein [Mesobacillus subterraneus]RSD28992.1 hypothetical protein EJA10_02455 [Mesobacillus subterraneus]